jgi:hypothetical protein
MRHTTRGRVAVALAVLVGIVLMAPTAPAASKPTVVKITVVKGRPVGGIKRPTVKKGMVVRFVVVADRGESVHLHGYDLEKRIRPRKPVTMQFVARIPGRFELELHEPDALLARLTVRP